jgi:small GTP-binding protein
MSLSVGIVGLPNAGKSTLFNALLGRQIAQVAEYPFTTIEPNVGVVEVPEARLHRLGEIVGVERIVPAAIKFIDIAGLVKDAHKGAGLGNQFLAKIREVDAVLHVVRAFESPQVAHVMGDINPERDIKIINEELKQAGINKPTFTYLNKSHPNESTLDEIIKNCYKLLDLVTMFTIEGGHQVQAWPVKRGTVVKEAVGMIHSDFRESFIRAEVVSFAKLDAAGSYQAAKAKGWVKVEGKDYEVKDGDVVTVKI